MFVLGSPIVDWSAIWKICLAVLIAGAGVVIVYGFGLLGLKLANQPASDGGTRTTSRVTGFALSIVCGVLVIGVVVIGIYAMTQKPSSSKSKPKKSAAALTVPTHHRRLVA